MGIWNGGHEPDSSTWCDATSCSTGCCHPPPIIQQHVRPGTIVWSDMWAAYNRVQHLPPVAQHQTVNHSIEFVNSATGVHTQNIESYWNRVKTKIKRMKGVHDHMMSSYLDEFMWRERHGRTASAALRSLCRDIALRYPV